jgi:Fe-S-cluster containining protein
MTDSGRYVEDLGAEDIVKMSARKRHFACTACGKCCNAAPSMSIDEAFDLADIFIMSVEIHFGQKTVAEDLYEIGHRTLDVDGSPIPAMMNVVVHPLDWSEHTNRCPALVGKLCGIYDRRPATCRTIPFDIQLAAAHVSRSTQWEPEFGIRHGYECDWTDAAPLVADARGIVDPTYAAAHAEGRALIRASNDYLDAIPREALQAMLHQSAPRGAPYTTSLLLFMSIAYRKGRLPLARAQAILESQVGLIDLQVAEALKRKMASERGTTNAIREIRKAYLAALANLDQALRELAV